MLDKLSKIAEPILNNGLIKRRPLVSYIVLHGAITPQMYSLTNEGPMKPHKF